MKDWHDKFADGLFEWRFFPMNIQRLLDYEVEGGGNGFQDETNNL